MGLVRQFGYLVDLDKLIKCNMPDLVHLVDLVPVAERNTISKRCMPDLVYLIRLADLKNPNKLNLPEFVYLVYLFRLAELHKLKNTSSVRFCLFMLF